MLLVNKELWRNKQMRKIVQRISFSACISLIICILSYAQDCCPYPMFDSLDVFCWIHNSIHKDSPLSDDVMLVSTSNDIELVNTEDGNAAITDRKKLVEFLEVADSCRLYKCILFDILFEKDYETNADSALGAVLCRLPRLIMVKSEDLMGNESSLQFEEKLDSKTAFNYYYSFFSKPGFSRYPYIQKGKASAAMKMYRILGTEKDTIKEVGPFLISHNRLCLGAPIISLSNYMTAYDYNGKPTITKCNIGSNYLNKPYNELSKKIEGKVIIIGNFDHDVHDTYVGKVPGSILAYASFMSLKEGRHIIGYKKFLAMFIIYFAMCILIISQAGEKVLNPLSNKHIGVFLLSFIGYSTILSLFSIFIYLTSGTIICTFVPSFIFSTITKLQECGVKI